MARPLVSPDRRTRCYVRPTMTLHELRLILYFLRRVVARGADEQVLLDLVEKIEKEIDRCLTRSR